MDLLEQKAIPLSLFPSPKLTKMDDLAWASHDASQTQQCVVIPWYVTFL